MENVKIVKMDLSHDSMPELLPANGKSGSDSDSASRVAEAELVSLIFS